MPRNALQTGYDDGNVLAAAPWASLDPSGPELMVSPSTTVGRTVDALGAWLAEKRAKMAQRGVESTWSPNNPVGTETLQTMGRSDPSFRPGQFVGGGTVPWSQEQIDAVRTGSQNAYDQLSQIAGAGRGGQAFPSTGRVTLASQRPLANPPPDLSLRRVNPRTLRPTNEETNLDVPGDHVYAIRNPAGERVGTVDTTWDPMMGDLRVENIEAPTGANSLGTAAIKRLRSALLEQYPDAKTLSGFRISGGGPDRETFQRVSRPK